MSYPSNIHADKFLLPARQGTPANAGHFGGIQPTAAIPACFYPDTRRMPGESSLGYGERIKVRVKNKSQTLLYIRSLPYTLHKIRMTLHETKTKQSLKITNYQEQRFDPRRFPVMPSLCIL
jgi:hypothetical protein